MTKQLIYKGTFKLNLLGDEMHATFPDWWIEIDHPDLGTVYESEFYLEGNEKGIRLIVPDNADEEAIEMVVLAHDPEAPTAGETLRSNIRAIAQSAVGVALNDLTQGQIKALLAVMLWKAGGIDKDMTVKPLVDWT